MRLVLVTCLFIGGCVLHPQKTATEETRLGAAEIRSARTAADAFAIGRSTKADVRAALGEGIVVDFESGYAVWVYRERLPEKAKPPASELVLLFEPSGVLAKTRIR